MAFLKDNAEKRRLEDELRKQLEDLQTSEEELRQNMEELQATQEKLKQELKASEAEVQAQINAINAAYSFVTFTPEGVLVRCEL